MTESRMLTLTELVQGLERDGMRYQALDVFAWHVQELRDALEHGSAGELQRLDPEQPSRAWFGFQRNGIDYQIKVRDSGVARLTRRSTGPSGLFSEQAALGPLGAAIRSSKEIPGILLGFLIGATLSESPDAPRRVLTVRYDEDEKTWRAYDGPLAKWMREQALNPGPALG